MNRLITAIKKIRVRQIFTAFMAGILMLVSTACNSHDGLAKTDVPQNIQRAGDAGANKLNEIGQKLDENKNALGRKTKELAENTRQGIENIKDNARSSIEGLKNLGKEAGTETKKKIDADTSTIKTKVSQGVEDIKYAANQATK